MRSAQTVTVEQVRELALSLPRTHEALVRDRIKFRVGKIVYLSFSRDEELMGFAFPKEERAALVASEPEKFLMPVPSDERFNWVRVRVDAVTPAEMREIVVEAWRMVVPKRVAAAHLQGTGPSVVSTAPVADAPTLDGLRAAARVFNGFSNVDAGWLRFLETTGPAADLSRAGHRAALLRWLNSWGCRIRYPREGEPDLLDSGLAEWWRNRAADLPSVSLAVLSDGEIDVLSLAYAELAALPVATGRAARSLGPTAAAKALYGLRPRAVMPWDAAIAVRLHGSRDGAAFGAHLQMGRAWARAVLQAAGTDEDTLPLLAGRPSVSLAKVLDEYLYVTITMASQE
ncbi:MmcQ/YjbR family DNA-binding protein [Streptosporangium sp. NPDC000239]|uniref:MmcQ/YjbR family DNA-binding protein n=1 Tax=Streptosporangium sp. NPDC000239 TaxID=3154248 RepID=UPI0033317119